MKLRSLFSPHENSHTNDGKSSVIRRYRSLVGGVALFLGCGDSSQGNNAETEASGIFISASETNPFASSSSSGGSTETSSISGENNSGDQPSTETNASEESTSTQELSTGNTMIDATSITSSEDTLGNMSSSGEPETNTTGIIEPCGNGLLDGGEQCDDGNDNNEDNCVEGCVSAACGDGHVQVGVEECDDGNDNNEDNCVEGCVSAACGDGHVQVGVEECDGGEENNDVYGCATNCETAPTFCGDNKIQANQGEKCEGSQGIADLNCDSEVCSYDFEEITQIHCSGKDSPDGIEDCGQGDADIICQLRTNNPNSKATDFGLNNTPLYLPLIGRKVADGISLNLGPIAAAGINTNIFYVPEDKIMQHMFKYSPEANGWITKVYCEGE